jgi:hypothetical protein
MKMIDEKGRLFGAINLFDLVILCMIGFLGFFAFKWISAAEDPSWTRLENVHVKAECVTLVPDYVAKLMKEGDEMVNAEGLVIARIEKIIKVEPMQLKLSVAVPASTTEEGQLFFDKENKKITLSLDMLAYRRSGGYKLYAANNPCLAGIGFTFVTQQYGAIMVISKSYSG